jgi:phospholipid/cholesterol/gamma-HCH transport system substrate-binding protein
MGMLGRTREESHEIVVGTGVVLTALALGLFLHLRPAGSSSGYDLQVHLAKTDGLGKGSEVRVSGVKVGTVTDLDLDPKSYLATVHMNIRDGVNVPTDSALEVTSGGLLGNLYVAIFPGKAATMLPPGGLIMKSCGAEDVMAMIGRVGLSNGQGSCKR